MNETIARQEENAGFARWMILRMLYACRPGAASEKIILKVLENLDFDCELNEGARSYHLYAIGRLTQHCPRPDRMAGAAD